MHKPTHTAKVALEWWRASGERTKERLLAIVAHVAEVNGQSDFVHHHEESALAAIRSWELKP